MANSLLKDLVILAIGLALSLVLVFILKSVVKGSNLEYRSQCDSDVQLYCPDVNSGGGRVAACLNNNRDLISATCQRSVARTSILYSHLRFLENYFDFLLYPTAFTAFFGLFFVLYNRFLLKNETRWNSYKLDFFLFVFNVFVSQFLALLIIVFSLEAYVRFVPLEWIKTLLSVGTFTNEYLILSWLIYILLIDFLGYLTHRALHSKYFWRLHASHHSSTSVDWSSNFRTHPFDFIFQSVLITIPICAFGFKSIKIPWISYALIFYALFVHSRIQPRMGFFKYIFVSPQFHREHHVLALEGAQGRNYGSLFTFWDILFRTSKFNTTDNGTFGISDTIPNSLSDHIVYPVRGLFK